jgi:hypothetical protein
MKKCLILLFILLSTQNLWAITFEDGIFPELATSARALAMGNAYICKVDDASAVFYNPAGLGTIRYPHFHMSNFAIETNKGGMSASTSGPITNSFSNLPKMFSIDGIRQVMKSHPGTLAHSRVHAQPNFTSRYFSFGFLYAKRTRAIVTNLTLPTGFEFADRTDMGPYASLNLSLFGGIIKIGVSGILLSRKELLGSTDPTATMIVNSSSYQNGTALITTGGAKITLPSTFLPTFAATIHNGLKAKFSGSGTAGAPPAIAQTIDAGFSITPQVGTTSRIHLEANFKDLTFANSGLSVTRRLLLGMELDFSRVFFFRLGYGDGFGSAGLGVKSKRLEFDLTTYAVDTSSSAYRGKEDRRFAIAVSSGF